MKTEWLEDFIALIEAGSFSQAAESRHVTQPAFSRRIRQLEEWLGVDLIDRNSTRLSLTPHAQAYEASLRDWLARLHALRSRIRSDAIQGPRAILATQHTLSVSYLPRLLRHFRTHAPEAPLHVRPSDRNFSISQFQAGEADLLLCSELEGKSLFTDYSEINYVILGGEQLIPVCASDKMGQPMFDLKNKATIPIINYAPNSFLGRALSIPYLSNLQRDHDTDIVCETAFTISIRELAIAGLGLCWLPHSLIEKDLEAGRLVSLLEELGGPRLVVACYRQVGNTNSTAEKLWQIINYRSPAV